MKPLATTPLEQESESSNIVFLVPDDVLRMPWHTGYRGGGGERERMQKRLNVLRFKAWGFFTRLFMYYLHLLNEMRKIDNL